MIGSCVGRDLTTGGTNIGIGRKALDGVITGTYNVAIGYRAGRSQYSESLGVPDATQNIAIGYDAGDTAIQGGQNQNIFLGYKAGDGLVQGSSTSTACTNNNDNILIGSNTGDQSYVCGLYCRNVLIGDRAGNSSIGVGVGTDYVNNALLGS